MKKFWIIVCIIAVIIFLGYIGKDMDFSKIGANNVATNSNLVTGKNGTTTKTNTNGNKTNNSNTANNTNKENTTNTTQNDNTNKTSNNTTENNQNKNETKQDNTTKAVEQNKASNEDIARELAKNTYGSSDGVYFKVEQVEGNGVYIISVRDAETTSALAWYNVDVNTKTVK